MSKSVNEIILEKVASDIKDYCSNIKFDFDNNYCDEEILIPCYGECESIYLNINTKSHDPKLLEMISCTKESLSIQYKLLESNNLSNTEIIELNQQLDKLHLRIMDLNRAGIIQKLKNRGER